MLVYDMRFPLSPSFFPIHDSESDAFCPTQLQCLKVRAPLLLWELPTNRRRPFHVAIFPDSGHLAPAHVRSYDRVSSDR